MNRRNFLKYAGITIITSKGIVFPKKEIIVPDQTIHFIPAHPMSPIVAADQVLDNWAQVYGLPQRYLREDDSRLRERILSYMRKVTERSVQEMLFGDWKNESVDRRVGDDDKKRLGVDSKEVEWKENDWRT